MVGMFDTVVEKAFAGAWMDVEELPRIDLYMDQILTLLEEGLSPGKRYAEEHVVTKTMINNYTKERLIMPVKGKKYTREQVMQLLCVLTLKQTLLLSDVKELMKHTGEKIDYVQTLQEAARLREGLWQKLPALVRETEEACTLPGEQGQLALALAFSAASGGLRRVCEGMIDAGKQG